MKFCCTWTFIYCWQWHYYVHKIKEITSFKKDDYEILMYSTFIHY